MIVYVCQSWDPVDEGDSVLCINKIVATEEEAEAFEKDTYAGFYEEMTLEIKSIEVAEAIIKELLKIKE